MNRDESVVLDALLKELLPKVTPRLSLAAGEELTLRITDLVEAKVRVDDLHQAQDYHEAADSDLEILDRVVEVHVNSHGTLRINLVISVPDVVDVDR